MKNNRGFIGVIIAIVALIIIGGGAVYFLTKTPATTSEYEIDESDVYVPEEVAEETNIPTKKVVKKNPVQETQEASCMPSSPSSITVLSPNGGEVYTAGQEITVKWESCNVSQTSQVIVALHQNGGWENVTNLTISIDNDGVEVFTLPDITVGSYKIRVGFASGTVAQDFSDNLFTINIPTISTSLPEPYISVQSGWPPVIQNSTTAYSCNVADPEESETSETIKKVINNRTYCITDDLEHATSTAYHEYTYTTANGSGTKTTNFTLRYSGCGVWKGNGTTKYDDCQTAQSTFDASLDAIIDSLM